MTVHLIANPAAGGGRGTRRAEAAASALELKTVVENHAPSDADNAKELLAALAADGAERVIVVGGDGMVHLAANAFAGTDTVLGIVPAGTGNDAAKALGLPGRVGAACEAALGDPSKIDLIECDGRFAVTVAIVGLAVDINERAERMQFPRGAAKYTVATLAELPRLDRHRLTVVVDGVEHDLRTNLLAVANLAFFGGGMRIAPDADVTDGALDVVSIGPAGAFTFARLLPTVFSGRHIRSRHVTHLRGATITITGAHLRLRADGEAWGELPVTLRAERSALSVAGI